MGLVHSNGHDFRYGGGGNPLRALATRLDPASLGEGRGPFYYRMSTSRGDAAEAGGADLHPLLGGGDQRATRDRITLDFSTGARSSGNVIRVPIRDGEGHEAVIERTLQALQIPGMSFSNPSAPEDSGTSAMSHDLRLFSRARTRSQFEYVFGANGPTAAGGSASADDEFLTRMQGEWRLINGTVSPLLTSSISRRVAEPLLEEAKANEAAAKKKADEEAAVAAEKAKKEEQERLQKEKEEADKKKEIDKAAEEAEREVAKAEEGSEPAAQSIASAAPSDSASAENPMSTEVDPMESSAADPAIPQTDDSNMPTLLPGTCGVVEGSSDGTPVSNSALSEAASAPTADVGAVEVPADVDGAVTDAAATGSSEAPGPSSDTAGTTSEAPQAEPEGVSSYEEEFLAAMPDDIRRELEMQQQLAASTAAANVPEEFLNALPPELQREVSPSSSVTPNPAFLTRNMSLSRCWKTRSDSSKRLKRTSAGSETAWIQHQSLRHWHQHFGTFLPQVSCSIATQWTNSIVGKKFYWKTRTMRHSCRNSQTLFELKPSHYVVNGKSAIWYVFCNHRM